MSTGWGIMLSIKLGFMSIWQMNDGSHAAKWGNLRKRDPHSAKSRRNELIGGGQCIGLGFPQSRLWDKDFSASDLPGREKRCRSGKGRRPVKASCYCEGLEFIFSGKVWAMAQNKANAVFSLSTLMLFIGPFVQQIILRATKARQACRHRGDTLVNKTKTYFLM